MNTFFDDTHIRQILQANDIIDVIRSYVALKPRGKEQVGLCPFHDDSRPSMYVNPVKQIFKCFACGAGGDVIKFIMLRENLTFPEAVRVLADRVGIHLPERRVQEDRSNSPNSNELEKTNRWAAKWFRHNFEDPQTGQQARSYVNERKIDEDIARKFGLGCAPAGWEHLVQAAKRENIPFNHLEVLGLVVRREDGSHYDRFRERLIFPVLDPMNRVIAFGGRTLGDDPAKYLNSPESPLFDKSRSLYGIHTAKDHITHSREAIIVEGYTDCLMAHQFGIRNVVATLGTALTNDHARVLSRYAERIVLLFDSDEAGQRAADRAIEVFFRHHLEVRLATIPEGKDPCDYLLLRGKEAFDEVIHNSVDALQYKWNQTCQRLNQANSLSGRQQAAEAFLELVAQAFTQEQVDAVTRGFIENHLAQLVGLPSEEVRQRVNRLSKQQRTGVTRQRNTMEERWLTLDSHENAIREIVEVLLNRPDLFSQVQQVLDSADEVHSERLKPLVQQVWPWCLQGEDNLAMLTATCEDPDICADITDLAQRGEERGNFEARLKGALERLEDEKPRQHRGQLRQELAYAAQRYGDDVEAALLSEIVARQKPDPRRPGAVE
ncbi:MAG: DNA primase [Sedimentisphaerales bacterium]|nr:DNA primase [Sedimentisphaerales bacterium]